MGIDGIGSSIVVALAAVLWLVYLTPTWFRQREYHATERNAVRLQQTLRILAETAEVPARVQAETTARSVVAHQKLVRSEQNRAEAIDRAKGIAMSRAAARTLASLTPEVAATVIAHSPAAYRLRRARMIGLASFAASLLAIIVGLLPFAAAASGALLALGALGAISSVLLLRKLVGATRLRNRIARELREQPAAKRPVGHALREFEDQPTIAAPWTPVPLPKPLYVGRPPAQSVVSASAIAQARATLESDSAESTRSLREAQAESRVTPISRSSAVPNRFSQMGIIEAEVNTVTDLDAVLRRRRAV